MKVLFDEKLKSALKMVARGIPSKTRLPILDGVHVRSDGESITLTATDLELTVRMTLQQPCSDFDAVISRESVDLITQMPGAVELSGGDDLYYIIRNSEAEYSMWGMSPEGFPSFPEREASVSLDTDVGDLKDAVAKTAFAAATKEKFTGVHFKQTGENQLRLAASDTYRMAVKKINAAWEKSGEFLISAKLLTKALKFLPRGKGSLRVSVSAARAIFHCGEYTLTLPVIAEAYPDVGSYIAKWWPTEWAETDSATLVAAIKRIALTDHAISFMAAQGEGIKLQLGKKDAGVARERITAYVYGESPFPVKRFNSKFLLEGLKGMNGKIIVGIGRGPLVVKDDEYLYLVMPFAD